MVLPGPGRRGEEDLQNVPDGKAGPEARTGSRALAGDGLALGSCTGFGVTRKFSLPWKPKVGFWAPMLGHIGL